MDEFLSVILVPTLKCDCSCTHCFESLSGDEMTSEAFRDYMTKIRDYTRARGIKILVFNWQGGEIFCLSPEKMALFQEILAAIFGEEPIEIHQLLQTNLMGYSEAWQPIIKKYFRGAVGSSLDFPNRYRKTPSTQIEAYGKKWLKKKAQAEADGIRVSVISVPNAETLDAGADRFYRYYLETVGARAIQLNLPFPGADAKTDVNLDQSALIEFFTSLHGCWSRDPEALPISPFAVFRSRIEKGRGRIPCIFSKNCAESFFCLTPTGDVGQCDAWATGFREFNFGNLKQRGLSDILASEHRALFLNRPFELLARTPCGECEFWKLCYGGCPVRAFAFTGDFNTPDRYCEVYKTVFDKMRTAFGMRMYEIAGSPPTVGIGG